MRVYAILLCPSALWLMALPARAEAPPARPLRDVDVTYKVPVPGQGGASLLQRYRWSAATQTQRVDLPTTGNWMVLDFATHRMALVSDQSHEVVDVPAPPQAGNPGYTRQTMADVAGLACTEWRTVDTTGRETQACYTQDGVLLRARAGSTVLMEAVSVSYAAQDASVFKAPEGYTHQQGSR